LEESVGGSALLGQVVPEVGRGNGFLEAREALRQTPGRGGNRQAEPRTRRGRRRVQMLAERLFDELGPAHALLHRLGLRPAVKLVVDSKGRLHDAVYPLSSPPIRRHGFPGGFFYSRGGTLFLEGSTGRPMEAGPVPSSRKELRMFRPPLRRVFAVLVVSLALTTPLCEAASPGSAPGRGRQAAATPSHVFGLWDWLTSLWATDGGCTIDPDGNTICRGHS
jgi:hypothetical protein